MSAALPIATAPTWESYHPPSVDATKCIGRRTSEAKADRRWSYIVYGAFQCTASRPIDGSGDLCVDCCQRRARESKFSTEASNWHGVVTDMASMPAWSHIAGSEWCRSGKPVWIGVAKPKGAYVRRALPAAPAPAPAPSTEDQLAAALMLLEEERAANAAKDQRLLAVEAEIASLRAWAAAAPPPPPAAVKVDVEVLD